MECERKLRCFSIWHALILDYLHWHLINLMTLEAFCLFRNLLENRLKALKSCFPLFSAPLVLQSFTDKQLLLSYSLLCPQHSLHSIPFAIELKWTQS